MPGPYDVAEARAPQSVDDPSLPCALCVGWQYHPEDEFSQDGIAVAADGSVIERIYSGLHEECAAAMAAYTAEHSGDAG